MFGKTKSDTQPARRGASLERLDIADLHFADELPESRHVDLPGRGEAFVRIAQGPAGAPTVLLVHGLMATADLNWSMAMPALATSFRVVAPDLRGHGRGLRTRRFTGDECADDLAALVETLELGRVIVVGYSLGGMVAQIFARRHPHLVAGLVLSATAAQFVVPTSGGPLGLLERMIRQLPESVRRSALLAMLTPKHADCARGRWLMEQVRRHDTLAILDATAEAGRFDSRSWLGSIPAPAAVIVTSDDAVVSPSSQRALARALGAVLMREVAGDHFACLKRPAEFNDALMMACATLAREYRVRPDGREHGVHAAGRGPAAGDSKSNARVSAHAGDGRSAHEALLQLEGERSRYPA